MRPGTLRLDPQPGTLEEGFGREGRIKVYESSMRGPNGQALLTIASSRHGMRLTKAQVDELMEFVGEWRAAHPA